MTIVYILLFCLLTGAIAGAWLIYRSDPEHTARRCLDLAKTAETLLEDNPSEARRRFVEVLKTLDRFARKLHPHVEGDPPPFQPGSAAWEAQMIADVGLAVVNHREGRPAPARDALERMRRRCASPEQVSPWVFRYHVLTGHVSDEAVKLYISALRSKSPLNERMRQAVVRRLKEACDIQPGMSEAELRHRAEWSQSTRTVVTDAPWPAMREGAAWLAIGDLKQAKTAYLFAASRFPEHLDAKLGLARVLGAMGVIDRLRAILKETTASKHADARILARAAEIFAEIGLIEDARRTLDRVQGGDAEVDALRCVIQARLLLARNERESAYKHLVKAAELSPNDVDIGILLAETLGLQGHDDRAVAALRRVISNDTRSPRELFAMGSALWNAGRYVDAAPWFERAAEHPYRAGAAKLLAGRCLIKAGRASEAIHMLDGRKGLTDAEYALCSFYQGVAFSQEGKLIDARLRFVRTHQLAGAAGDSALAKRAATNALTCCIRIAKSAAASGEYDQAVKALEIVRRNSKPDGRVDRQAAGAIVECRVRSAIRSVESDADRGFEAAMTSLAAALEVEASPRVERLLAGLHASSGGYPQAARIYERLLEQSPHDEGDKFAYSICSLRGRGDVGAIDRLKAVAGESGPFALRAALAVGSHLADNRQFHDAAQALFRPVRRATETNDAFLGEACCRLVLYTIQDGRADDAKKLASRFFGAADADRADVMLGSLLAHEGCYDEALRFLERGVSAGSTSSPGGAVLKGVYQRVAAAKCRTREFDDAASVLQRAARRFDDGHIRQFAELTKAATGARAEEIDERTLDLLSGVCRGSASPHPMIARATAIGFQRVARKLTHEGEGRRAETYWSEAESLLLGGVMQNAQFWADFIDQYNEGKKYKLRMEPAELRRRVMLRMAEFHLVQMRDALRGFNGPPDPNPTKVAGSPFFSRATSHWERAQRFAGRSETLRLLEEIAPVERLVREHAVEHQVTLYKWIYDYVDRRIEHLDTAGNLALDYALRCLVDENVPTFLEYMQVAASTNRGFQEQVDQVRKLGEAVVLRIAQDVNAHPQVYDLKRQGPEVYRLFLFRIVMVYASNEMPSGFGPASVPDLLDRAMEIAWESLQEN